MILYNIQLQLFVLKVQKVAIVRPFIPKCLSVVKESNSEVNKFESRNQRLIETNYTGFILLHIHFN